MTCSNTQKHLRAYLDGELGTELRAQVSAHLQLCVSCRREEATEREFDECLRRIDDFYGDAPGLAVPGDFMARVIDRAQVERLQSREIVIAQGSRSVWQWFWDFSMPLRLAAVSALLLATVGGIRAGQVITGLITAGQKVEPANNQAIHLDMTPAELSLVQLIRSEGMAVTGKQGHKPEAQQ